MKNGKWKWERRKEEKEKKESVRNCLKNETEVDLSLCE